jgi:membrane fusion protein (multidrug efflux system)
LALLAVALAASAACSKPQAGNGPAAAAGGPVPVVTTVAAKQPMGVEIEAVGTTRANESVVVTSKDSNTITAIQFAEGAVIERGAVLVEMEDAEAQAALAEAQAALADSQNQFTRSQSLVARQALSVAELDQLQALLKAAEARVAAAQARLDDTVIRAPFTGRTGFRQVSAGSYVGAGTPITTLDDTSVIKLDFTVPETYLFVVKRGLPVTASSTGLPGREFTGQVTNMESRVDPVTRSIIVRAEIPNPDGELRQGMFMTVSLRGEELPTLLVPEGAIVPEQGRTYVFVVRDDVVEQREVTIGKRRPGDVEIVMGLAENERVVVEGTQNVRHGTAVREATEDGLT